MSIPDKQILRIAARIRSQLFEFHKDDYRQLIRRIQQLLDQASHLQTSKKQLNLCLAHCWDDTRGKVLSKMSQSIRDLPYYVTSLQNTIDQIVQLKSTPSVRDIYEELKAAEREFGNLQWDRESDELFITTDPIELEGVFLGDFEIRLDISHLEKPEDQSVRVVALNPNPAASNSIVTHPHVSDERVCMGDGLSVVRAALTNGRIGDFFQVMVSVLETYNPDSPYVSLDDWCGLSCYDCGYLCDSESTYWCHSCDNDFCDQCVSYCSDCGEATCNGCLRKCPICDEGYCYACLTKCPDCEQPICKKCLEDFACSCKEELENIDEHQTIT